MKKVLKVVVVMVIFAMVAIAPQNVLLAKEDTQLAKEDIVVYSSGTLQVPGDVANLDDALLVADYGEVINLTADQVLSSNVFSDSLAQGNNITINGNGHAIEITGDNLKIDGQITLRDCVLRGSTDSPIITISSGAAGSELSSITLETTGRGIYFEESSSVMISDLHTPNSSAPIASSSSGITNNGSDTLVPGYMLGVDFSSDGAFSPTVFFPSLEEAFTNCDNIKNASVGFLGDPGVFYAMWFESSNEYTNMLNNVDLAGGCTVKLIPAFGKSEIDCDVVFSNDNGVTIQAVYLDDLDGIGSQIKFTGSTIKNLGSGHITLKNFDLSELCMSQQQFEAETGFNAPGGSSNGGNKFSSGMPTPDEDKEKHKEVIYLSGEEMNEPVSNMPNQNKFYQLVGETVEVYNQEPIRKGYVFIGWKNSVDGLIYKYGETDSFVMPDSDVELTAQWEKKTIDTKPEENENNEPENKENDSDNQTMDQPANNPDSLASTAPEYQGTEVVVEKQVDTSDNTHSVKYAQLLLISTVSLVFLVKRRKIINK